MLGMLSRFIPSSLFVRFILIIVLPTIFAQLIATYIFYNRHWYSVSKNMAHSLTNDIQVVYELKDIGEVEREKIQRKLNIQIQIKPMLDKKNIIDYYDSETEFLYVLLKKHFHDPIQIKFIDDNNDI